MEVAGLALAAAFVQKLTERIREQFPVIDGWGVNLLAYGLGVLLGFGFNLHAFAALGFEGYEFFDNLMTGLGLGAGSGFLADWSGRSGPRSRCADTQMPYYTVVTGSDITE